MWISLLWALIHWLKPNTSFSLFRLANPGIVQPYCWLLLFYEENNPKTNHYIVKMLHRIAVDLKMYPMLFQLSLFVVFNKILNSPAKNQFQVCIVITLSLYNVWLISS